MMTHSNRAKAIGLCAAMAAMLFLIADESSAIGRGGGGRGGGGRGGGGRPSVSRPRTSAPNIGGSRPNISRPSPSRPSVSRPSVSRPSVNRPNVSQPGINRPSPGRPSQLPNINRPSSGLKPGGGVPSRPSFPSTNLPRPGQSNPGLGQRPNTSLPNVGSRPGSGQPGLGNRPSLPSGGNRPSIGDRPTTRPTPGGVGDFLGIDRPIGPGGDRPTTLPARPGIGDGNNRPNLPGVGDRPGIGDRPGLPTRPGGDKPNRPDWIGDGNRPGVLPERPNRPSRPGGGIHDRPDWADRPGIGDINNRWPRPGRPDYGMGNWIDRHPDRYRRWNNWGNNVRVNINNRNIYNNCFNARWWNGHYHGIGGWHYGYCFNRYPYRYWWSVPRFVTFRTWFTWSAPATVWQEPIYYDYGTGGNVYYENNVVYVDGQEVGTPQDFAASAAALATVEPPQSQQQAEAIDWMPLGTFAVSSSQKESQPTRYVQLAVNKQGVISGTLYDEATDISKTLLGQVDKETQRVAIRVGESEDIVVETGLYNLTQDEAPIMVHYGPDKVENWLLVRLESPESDDSQ